MIFNLPEHTFYAAESKLKNCADNPLFSVIVNTYDREEFLKETIESLLNQTYKNIEIVIVDHNAKKENKVIIEQFVKENKHISIVKYHENHGAYKAVLYCWNAGLKYASGQFVGVLNDDDFVSDNYVEMLVPLFLDNPNCNTAAAQPVSEDE